MTPNTELPPEAVLKYYRALGVVEFAHACGWEVTDKCWAWVPVDQFRNLTELADFCDRWKVKTNIRGLAGDYPKRIPPDSRNKGKFHLLLFDLDLKEGD